MYAFMYTCVRLEGEGYCTKKLLKEDFVNATFIDHNDILKSDITTSKSFLYEATGFFYLIG